MKPAILFLFLFNCITLLAQEDKDRSLLPLLAGKDKIQLRKIDSTLIAAYEIATDTGKKALLHFYTTNANSNNLYTAVRCLLWQGIINLRPPFRNTEKAFECMQQAIRRAVESGDEYLMISCFEVYALDCMSTGKPETALFYFLKSGEIRNRVGDQYLLTNNAGFYGQLGDLLYKMQEYRDAIKFIRLMLDDERTPAVYHARNMNTIGLAYQHMGKQDSALYWYDKALAAAGNDTVWQGIISGNIGASYFEEKKFDRALPLLWKDYTATLSKEPRSAGNTLHRIALIYLEKNKPDSALKLARKSYALVTASWPYNAGYIKNASYALSRIFKQLGNADSAFLYGDKYHYINDSLNRVLATNRADVVQAKLDFEKLSGDINILLSEKKAEKTRRNFLLAGIVLVLATAWFYSRWQRQQYQNRQQELLHQQQMTEAAMNNAKEKLEAFTRHLIEKNQLIETLQSQLLQQHQDVNEELQNQSILTENDWLRFKEMFEKANPGFIGLLQTAAPDITTAELRLAALLRLNLGNKHIASMLGIGTDAVRKTKSRLRQRLQITLEDGLEEYIKGIDAR